MKTTKSNYQYLCDCWVEAVEFAAVAYWTNNQRTGALSDIVEQALNCQPQANVLVWRFLEHNQAYYLSEMDEPIPLPKKWLEIPPVNSKATGNFLFQLSSGILGKGNVSDSLLGVGDVDRILGSANGRLIVVNSVEWKKFITSQSPDADVDLSTLVGRAAHIGHLWDNRQILRKEDAYTIFTKLGFSIYQTDKAWALAREDGRPEMGYRGRKSTPKE